jgi:hypothetical protein
MKTSTKWILGISIGLVVGCIFLAVVGGAGYFMLNRSGLLGWEMGSRLDRPWGGQVMPYGRMPMHAYPGTFGFFSPLRYIAFPLICLGILLLLVLGIVALVRSVSRPHHVETSSVPAPAPAQATTETPVQSEAVQAATHNCPNCGRESQEDWVSCPYCGAPLK